MTLQDKLDRMDAIEKELASIQITQEDRCAFASTLFTPLWDLGVDTVRVQTYVPSFNDGDPCLPTLDSTYYVTLKQGVNLADFDDYERPDDEETLHVWDLGRLLKDLGGSPDTGVLNTCEGTYSRTLEKWLDYNKLPVNVSFTYRRDASLVVHEEMEDIDSPY